jgi:hypothetical protein
MRSFALAILAAVVMYGVTNAQTTDPHFGTWKLNPAKSKRDASQGPAAQSQIRKYEPFEKVGIKITIETVTADGSKTSGGYSGHFDGKPFKTVGSQNFDTVVLKRVDSNTFQSTNSKAGKVYQVITNTVSKDGKTLTVTAKGTNAKGQPFTSISVFDKQ